MKKATVFIALLVLFACGRNPVKDIVNETVLPEYQDEMEISIQGYFSHAMEPFISADGNTLFFNSLNDSINTSLHYAVKTSETAFSYRGEVGGVNGASPHLDAVPSLDNNGTFYFVSTRGWPGIWENYQKGTFAGGVVTGVSPVLGDIYIREAGWIIMDAEISRDGTEFYYVNAKFTGGALPEESRISVARKEASGFIKMPESTAIFENINLPGYLCYAPSTTADGRTLFFTRIKKGTFSTDIMVSMRVNKTSPFKEPRSLNITGEAPEAVTVLPAGERIYYHKKKNGVYTIFTKRLSGR